MDQQDVTFDTEIEESAVWAWVFVGDDQVGNSVAVSFDKATGRLLVDIDANVEVDVRVDGTPYTAS